MKKRDSALAQALLAHRRQKKIAAELTRLTKEAEELAKAIRALAAELTGGVFRG